MVTLVIMVFTKGITEQLQSSVGTALAGHSFKVTQLVMDALSAVR